MAQAQAQGGSRAAAAPADAALKGASAGLAGAADVLVGVARDALTGLDAILSYRPPQANGATGDHSSSDHGSSDHGSSGHSSSDHQREPDNEPDHRG
jgi:hypothetical protein